MSSDLQTLWSHLNIHGTCWVDLSGWKELLMCPAISSAYVDKVKLLTYFHSKMSWFKTLNTSEHFVFSVPAANIGFVCLCHKLPVSMPNSFHVIDLFNTYYEGMNIEAYRP